MPKINRALIFYLVITILIYFPSKGSLNASSQQEKKKECEISGVVENKNGKGIKNILIKAYRENVKISPDKEIRSDSDGNYSIKFIEGEPITDVFYKHAEWRLGALHNISGGKNHKINKVLYRVGEEMPEEEREGYASAVTRYFNIQYPLGMAGPANYNAFYGEVGAWDEKVPIATLAKMPTPIFELCLAETKKSSKKNLFEFIVTDGSFKIWENLSRNAQIDKELTKKGPYTIILPIDSAFSALSPGILAKAIASKKMAQQIVFPQIIQGRFEYRQIVDMRSVKTLYGYREIGSCLLNPIVTNIRTKNGLIHVVERLYPEIVQYWK